jgi:hypothetical protein
MSTWGCTWTIAIGWRLSACDSPIILVTAGDNQSGFSDVGNCLKRSPLAPQFFFKTNHLIQEDDIGLGRPSSGL